MNPKIHQRRIPTIFAFLLLFLGIGITIYLVQRGTFIVSEAAPDYEPRDVVATNATDYSFSVTFWTQDPSLVTVDVEGVGTFLSEASTRSEEVTTHSIPVTGLSPNTEYSYSIYSNGKDYMSDSTKFRTTTAGELPDEFPEITTLSGKVLLPSGGNAVSALVFLTVEDSQVVSTTTNDSGEYVFEFPSGLRTSDLKGFYLLEEGDSLDLVSRLGELSSRVTAEYMPRLPTITLSHNFSFDRPSAQDPVSTDSSELFVLENIELTSGFTVINPTEGDFLVDSQPEIYGTGVFGTAVSVEISPADISGTVVVGENNTWSFRPETPLTQGASTITVRGVGPTGVTLSKVINFQVFPSGSQVSQSATPSATPIPTTIVPTVTATPIPTPIVTTPPVGAPVVPTIIPTQQPSPTEAITPSPTPFLKVTPTPPGSVGGVILTFASLAFIVTGAALLFFLG